MNYLSDQEILTNIVHSVNYSAAINPYHSGLEYFKKFTYHVIMSPVDFIPIQILDDIISYFNIGLPNEKHIKDLTLFGIILKRISVDIVKPIHLGFEVKIMIWYHYYINESISRLSKTTLELPVALKVERPRLR